MATFKNELKGVGKDSKMATILSHIINKKC